jgi:hypothetical protein
MGKKSRKPKKKAAADVARQMTAEADESPSILGGASLGKRPKICVVCGDEALKKCAGCVSTRYCSTECQTRHWPRHEKTCPAMKVVVGAKDAMVEIRRIATEYFTIAVPALAKHKSTATTPKFREDRERTIAALQGKWREALKGLLIGVAVAAVTTFYAEGPEAAAAIAKSGARHALNPIDPPERARFLGTVFDATFDSPKRHELVAVLFRKAFAGAKADLNVKTDEARAALDFALFAAFEVIAADVAKHVVHSAAAAESPEAAVAFAKAVVLPVVKQFPHHPPLLYFMDSVLDKAEAAAVAENSRSRELYAIYSTCKAVGKVLLEVIQEWQDAAEAAPADSASRDVAPPVAPT